MRKNGKLRGDVSQNQYIDSKQVGWEVLNITIKTKTEAGSNHLQGKKIKSVREKQNRAIYIQAMMLNSNEPVAQYVHSKA